MWCYQGEHRSLVRLGASIFAQEMVSVFSSFPPRNPAGRSYPDPVHLLSLHFYPNPLFYDDSATEHKPTLPQVGSEKQGSTSALLQLVNQMSPIHIHLVVKRPMADGLGDSTPSQPYK
jgi:hypothetical protein